MPGSLDPGCDTAYGGIVSVPRIVLDTNVLVSGLRSRLGSAFRVLTAIADGKVEVALSVPLVLEYEDALLRATNLSATEIRQVVAYLCSVGYLQKVYFLWRPFLRDPGDDLVLELAVAAGASQIVTFNQRDFRGVERFGVSAIEPRDLLVQLGEIDHGNA